MNIQSDQKIQERLCSLLCLEKSLIVQKEELEIDIKNKYGPQEQAWQSECLHVCGLFWKFEKT